jgi:adenylate cyclase
LRYLFEDCVLDIERRELRRGANMVSITPQVFDLLAHLIRNRDHVVSKDDLIDAIWKGRIVSDAAVTTRLNAARNAIGDSGEEQRLIKTLPRKGFRFVGSVLEQQGSTSTGAPEEPRRPDLTSPNKPSIAVLPFNNVSPHPEQEYMVDAIVDDIITELSRFSELFVIARNSSFQYKGKATDVRQIGRDLGVRYVLEGSLRRGGDRIRISAKLIDAVTGTHRWAEHYDRTLEDVFAVQDEVVRTIVAILTAHVRMAETERSRTKPPRSWQAYDYYLKAIVAYSSFDRSFEVDHLYEARRLLQQSLDVDPDYARSYAVLAQTYVAAWYIRLDADFLNPGALDQAYQFARKSVEIDPNLPEAHAQLGFALMARHELDASIAAFERANALNPNYVNWYFGVALVRAGDPRRAIEIINRYVRLDPLAAPFASGVLGFAHYMIKDYAAALPLLIAERTHLQAGAIDALPDNGPLVSQRDCVSVSPNMRGGHVWLAATYAQMGKLKEARKEIAEVVRIEPNYTIGGIARPTITFKNAEDDHHYFDGLRKAGLPE